MRIIGGHDYYDIGLSLGLDPNIIFKRDMNRGYEMRNAKDKFRAFRVEKKSFFAGIWRRSVSNLRSWRELYVMFCGKMFAGLMNHDTGKYYWNYESLKKDLKENEIPVNSDFFDLTPFAHSFAKEVLLENKASIGVCWPFDYLHENINWDLDVSGLDEIGFMKVIDPFTAFQELSMWVSNYGIEANPIVELKDEKVMLQKHGMDNWSFKKRSVKH